MITHIHFKSFKVNEEAIIFNDFEEYKFKGKNKVLFFEELKDSLILIKINCKKLFLIKNHKKEWFVYSNNVINDLNILRHYIGLIEAYKGVDVMKQENLKEKMKNILALDVEKEYRSFRYFLIKKDIEIDKLNLQDLKDLYLTFLQERKPYIKGLRNYKHYINIKDYNSLFHHLKLIKEPLELKSQGHLLNFIYEVRAYSRKHGDFNTNKIVDEIFPVPGDANYIRKSTGLKKMSSFKKLPFDEREYTLLTDFLLSSSYNHYIFLGIFLSTGLRPIDIEMGEFFVEDGNKLLISEISKTNNKDFEILTLKDINLLLDKIIYLQRTGYNAKRGKAKCYKEILELLNLETLYEIRALYANSLYFLFLEKFNIDPIYKDNLNNFIARSLCHPLLSSHNQNYYIYTGEIESGKVTKWLKNNKK